MTNKHKEITFAKHDPAMALMPIVRPIYRGKKPERFDITQKFNGGSIRLLGPYLMTPVDQSVLLALLGIAGTESHLLTSEPEDRAEEILRHELSCHLHASEESTIYVDTSLYRVCQLVYGGERSIERYGLIRESIVRIRAITLQVLDNHGKHWGSSQLLSYAGGDGNRIQVAINWRIAQAVAGVDVQHVRISLKERQALKCDTAQIIHGWISAWLKPRQSRLISTDKLTEKVWGNPAKGSTQRMRKKRVRDALALINNLPGWVVTSNQSDIHQIQRISALTVTI